LQVRRKRSELVRLVTAHQRALAVTLRVPKFVVKETTNSLRGGFKGGRIDSRLTQTGTALQHIPEIEGA
jgi:hypothetical protein